MFEDDVIWIPKQDVGYATATTAATTSPSGTTSIENRRLRQVTSVGGGGGGGLGGDGGDSGGGGIDHVTMHVEVASCTAPPMPSIAVDPAETTISQLD